MRKIKLFVCCHRPFLVPDHPLLVPIQVGAALSDKRFDGYLHDDEGENISDKNRAYCELTAQYWAWKNVDSDYYGFFHYRRYLYADPNAKRPYRIAGEPGEELLRRLNFSYLENLIHQCDLIVPKGENMYIPVREHYSNAPFHHRKDLDLVEEIIRKNCPEYVSAMEQYLAGTICYFGNIYVMSKKVFFNYCSWLFLILEEFDNQADLNGYGPQELRVDGYLAERLFGIYYTRHKECLRTLELPRVHFHGGNNGAKKRLVNTLLPPGSRRRSIVKTWRRSAD